MRIYRFILTFLGIAAILGCETLITDLPENMLPDQASKLVVYSFISPQSNVISAVVTQSTPIFSAYNQQIRIVNDAVVIISDGTRQRQMTFDTVSKDYQITSARFPIQPGKTYTLTVSQQNRKVKAVCSIPLETVPILSYRIDSIRTNTHGVDTSITVQMTWDDLPSQKNHYRVRAFSEIEYSVLERDGSNHYTERRIRSLFPFDWNDHSGKTDLFDDENMDGLTMTSTTGKSHLPEIQTEIAGFRIQQKPRIISVTLELLHTDEAYYQYHRTLQHYRNTNNPFSEPILVFSNIEGGLGCFAGYNSKILNIRK
jgi:hypothetical protein